MGLSGQGRQILKTIFLEGLETVKGKAAVSRVVDQDPAFRPTMIAAVGKAAIDMYQGCAARFADVPAFVVTKYDHGAVEGPGIQCLQAAHPVPDQNSLRAGEELAAWIERAVPDDVLLMLVSGGASALVEMLDAGTTLEDLKAMTAAALANGSTIEQLNAQRIQRSLIKGGKLLTRFPGREMLVLAISDVASDGIDVIGSGIGDRGQFQGTYRSQIIASNSLLRNRLADACVKRGLAVVVNAETLNAPVEQVVDETLATVDAAGPGLFIFGGEPTIALPDNPGIGGRAQALALLFAKAIAGRSDIDILVSGTDGSDGVSEATGAIVDGETFSRVEGADSYLLRADSGSYFRKTDEAIVTGPTGTNVADVVIVLRH